jgi:hypothetical protein
MVPLPGSFISCQITLPSITLSTFGWFGNGVVTRCYPIGGKWGLRHEVFVEKKGFGEPGRTRTSNPLIKSQLLYH